MIKAIAIDDEPPALHVLENFCSQVSFISLEKTFTQPAEALKYLKKFPVDLLFLDIQMPSFSGIELYKKIQQETMVIFTTAYSEYAIEGFNLNAVDYLLKPYAFDRFLQACNKANEYFNFVHQTKPVEDQFIFIRADYSLVKITIADILYIEGLDDYSKIYLQNNTNIVARITLKSILEKLPTQKFIRVHRSFIVPFEKIERVRNKTIMLANDKEIPVGSSYETEFFNRFGSK